MLHTSGNISLILALTTDIIDSDFMLTAYPVYPLVTSVAED